MVYPYWTNLTYSENPEDWEKDLKEHKKEKNTGDDWRTFFDLNPSDEYGGFGLDLNSLEELTEVSEYFRENGFMNQLTQSYPETKKKRLWFLKSEEGMEEEPGSLEEGNWGCSLFLYPLEWSHELYKRLRGSLSKLWKLGYLVYYKGEKYY